MKVLLIISALAQAQQIGVHEAVDIALANHPAIAYARASAERADFATREISATRLPQLNVESSWTRFAEPMVVAPLHGFDPQRPPVFDRTLAQGSLTLGYTLFDAGRGDRVARMQALAAAADAQTDATRAQVIAETVRAFLRAGSAREIHVAQSKQVTALLRERDRAHQLVNEGRAARVVLLRADAALSAAQADAINAQAELDVAHQELARLLALPASAVAASGLPAVRVAGLRAADRATLLDAAARANPEMRRLHMQRVAAQAERSAARGSWLPRVQLGGRFIEYASSATSPEGEWQAGAQISYPLYTGGARGATIDRAAAEARVADADHAWGQRRTAEAVDRALTALVAATARTAALTAAVAQSEEVTRIDRLALAAGAGVQTDYLAAEAALFRARATLTEARAQEVLARVELARVTGELTTDWLAAHLESVR